MGNELKDALGELYVEHMHIAIKALTIANSIGIPKNDEERALLAKLLETYNTVMQPVNERIQTLTSYLER